MVAIAMQGGKIITKNGKIAISQECCCAPGCSECIIYTITTVGGGIAGHIVMAQQESPPIGCLWTGSNQEGVIAHLELKGSNYILKLEVNFGNYWAYYRLPARDWDRRQGTGFTEGGGGFRESGPGCNTMFQYERGHSGGALPPFYEESFSPSVIVCCSDIDYINIF